MRFVRMGGDTFEELEKIDDNKRRLLKVRSLIRVISIQREILTTARPIVYNISYGEFQKKKTDDSPDFEKEENDYSTLIKLLKFLKYAEREIVIADKTQTQTDDFLIWVEKNGERKAELTENFYEMIDDLEDSYEKLYVIMLRNGIIEIGRAHV